jgi:uncharacterized DUF497 family protein
LPTWISSKTAPGGSRDRVSSRETATLVEATVGATPLPVVAKFESAIDVDSAASRWYKKYTMSFEFDTDKSVANKQKHGIDFVRAQALWEDPDLIEIPARTTDEPQCVVVGRIGSRHWSAIITYRDDCVRIISVRRSRTEEVKIYEG